MVRRLPRGAATALLFVGSLLAAASIAGCGSDRQPTFPVSGTVTLDAKPLAEGTVYFKTAATGAVDSMPIKDGKFEGRAAEGERRVEITAYRVKVLGTGQMKGEVQESLVAKEYNAESTLTASVSPNGKNSFEFAVKSR